MGELEITQKKTQEDSLRVLLEHTIRYGRSKQSPLTGFVHLCYQKPEEDEKSCIPIVENALYALALFHTRTMENINEGKELISKLLHLQSKEGEFTTGNFPVYFHEYPHCCDRLLVVNLLPPFYWILKLYASVLGTELKKKLEVSLLKGLEHSLKAYREKKLPFSFSLKIGASALAVGRLLQNQEWEKIGEGIVQELCAPQALNSLYSPGICGDVMISLQMIYSEISLSSWGFLWTYLVKTWHRGTCCYIGPPLKDYQYGKEPQPTIYDLFFGVLTGEFSHRALLPSSCLLQGVLIRPSQDQLPVFSYPFTYETEINGGKWHVEQGDHYAYCTFTYDQQALNLPEKGLHELRLIWGSQKLVHTFVCQGGNSKQTTLVNRADGVDFYFVLGEQPPVDDREKSREAIFYFDAFEGQQITVEDQKTTTFQLGEHVNIVSDSFNIQVQFELVEGDGAFFGHLMKGNRPSQLANKGENRYQSYDWQLFMRTLRRSDHCLLKASVSYRQA